MAVAFRPRRFHIEILRAINTKDWGWYTSYEIIKAVEDRRKAEGRYHWWSMVSYGGLHWALHKLLRGGYIEDARIVDHWKYRITTRGMSLIFVFGEKYK